MSSFLERNKKKGLLALLLLLLRGRKSHLALLLLLLLMMMTFVLPRNALSLFMAGVAKLPGGAAIVRRFNGPTSDFSTLMAAFRAAKSQRHSGWGVFFDADAAKRGRSASGSSIDMVKGGKAEMESAAALANVKGGQTIGGVLTPEDSERREEAVALSPEDLGGERAQLAAADAGVLQRGLLKLGAGLGAFGFGQGAGAYAGKSLLSGGAGTAANNGPDAAMRAGTTAPSAAGSGSQRLPGVDGKLAKILWRASQTLHRSARTRVGGNCTGSRCAMHQLLAGRTQMMLARDPLCTPGTGCAPEFASTNSGQLFDGNQIGANAPGIISAQDPAVAPQVDGVTTPNVQAPGDGDVQNYIDEANEIEEDMRKCEEWRAAHREEDQRNLNDLQGIGARATQLGCEDVDCGSSPSRIRRCKRLKRQANAKCAQVNRDKYEECMNCPYMAREGCDPQPTPDCYR